MTQAYNNPLPEHDRWVQRIAGNSTLDALSWRQVGRILRSITPIISTTPFYCSTKSFRGLFGQLPTELNSQLLPEAINL